MPILHIDTCSYKRGYMVKSYLTPQKTDQMTSLCIYFIKRYTTTNTEFLMQYNIVRNMKTNILQ